MPRPKHTPEIIIGKLREVEVLVAKGATVAEASRQIGVTEQTLYRWRKEYGGSGCDFEKPPRCYPAPGGKLAGPDLVTFAKLRSTQRRRRVRLRPGCAIQPGCERSLRPPFDRCSATEFLRLVDSGKASLRAIASPTLSRAPGGATRTQRAVREEKGQIGLNVRFGRCEPRRRRQNRVGHPWLLPKPAECWRSYRSKVLSGMSVKIVIYACLQLYR